MWYKIDIVGFLMVWIIYLFINLETFGHVNNQSPDMHVPVGKMGYLCLIAMITREYYNNQNIQYLYLCVLILIIYLFFNLRDSAHFFLFEIF